MARETAGRNHRRGPVITSNTELIGGLPTVTPTPGFAAPATLQ
jgi:hypothetical protein